MSLQALFFGAHPDDVELTSGGLAAMLASHGHPVGIIDLTAGELGTRGTREVRAAEAAEAARVLGVALRECLALPDGGLDRRDRTQLAAVAGALRRHRPALVVAPDRDDAHPDHVEASQLVARACYLAGLERFEAAGERFRPATLLHALYRGTSPPSLVVDITPVWERRRAALAAHRSQFDPAAGSPTYLAGANFLAEIESRARVWGSHAGGTYGEAFRSRGPLALRDARALLAREAGVSARPAARRPRKPRAQPTSARSPLPEGKARRPRRRIKIGISCYAHFGGSGVVASELGLELAHRGYEVHFIASRLPFRLRSFASNVYFHESSPAYYPVFEEAPSNLALAAKMVEVAENYGLDLMHVHYAMPFATSAYLARQMMLPRQLGVVTTLHGTDITVVGAEPAFYRVTQFGIESSDRVTAVSRYLKERAEATFGVRRPIEVVTTS